MTAEQCARKLYDAIAATLELGEDKEFEDNFIKDAIAMQIKAIAAERLACKLVAEWYPARQYKDTVSNEIAQQVASEIAQAIAGRDVKA